MISKARSGGASVHATAPIKYILVLLVLVVSLGFAQGNLSTLKQATVNNPADVNAWIDLGNAYLELNNPDEAKNAFLEAIALDYRSGDAHFGLGLSEYAKGDYQAALFEFNEVTRLYPERFDGHFNRAVTLAKLRQYEDSAEAFKEAIAQAEPEATDNDKINAYLGLAGNLKRNNDYAGAAEAYGAALNLRPNDNELAYQQADALYRAGQGLDALPALTELEANSSDYRVSALIADIYVQEDQVDYALRSLERALRKAEGAADSKAQASILVKLGLLQRDLGRDSEAVAAFEQATMISPDAWEAQYNLAVSYLESGQPGSALEPLQKVVTLNPDNGDAYLALATAYDQLGQPSEALSNAEAALQRLEDEMSIAQANFIVGRSLYRQGDFRGASIALERVVEAQPDNAQAQLWAGLAEYQQGNFDQSLQYYERAVQLSPDSIEARVNLGAAYLASARYQDAELVYRLLVEENSSDAESFYNLGWALYSQNRREPAKEAWQASSDLGYQPAKTALSDYY